MFKKALFIGIGTALLAVPFISSAQTIGDLQAQIQSLLSQIQSLQSQSSTSSPISGMPIVGPAMPSCPSFARSLSVGARGTDVMALQQFLSAQGYLSVSATGYFGVLTKAAVGRWQAQNGIAASGSAGFGIFGPLSRSWLSRSCGTGSSGSVGSTTTTTGESFSANPSSGMAPLTVQFISSAPQGTDVGGMVDFGDGATGTLAFVPTCSSCNAMGTVSHTYATAGTYTATLTDSPCVCPQGGVCNCPNMRILGTTSVTVTSSVTTSTSTASAIEQLNAPGSVVLAPGGIAEIRNESFYFTLQSLAATSATIQISPVGCWNSFPSDTPPQVRCMLALLPIPPQTLSIGQEYASQNYGITLSQIDNDAATFSLSASSTVQ